MRTLISLNDLATIGDVLDQVYERVKDQLADVDLESLPSKPTQIRWRNTAQWARNSLVKEGLMRDDSRRGIWEISDAGRRFLDEHG